MGRIPFRKPSPRSRRLHKFGMHVEGMFLYLFRLLVPPMPPQHASASWRILVSQLAGGKSDEQTDPLQVTEDLNPLFETWMRKRPDQWLYMKRRCLKGAYNMSPGHNSLCA